MKPSPMTKPEVSPEALAQLRAQLIEFVGRRVRTRTQAEDIVQDIFERLERPKPAEVKNPRAWLYQSARNAIVDHYRTTKSHVELPAELPEIPDDNAPNPATQQLALCLEPLLSDLPEKYSRAVRLVDLEGQTHKQAAEIESISLSGMKSRVQRGRAQLGTLLLSCCTIEATPNGEIESYRRNTPTC